MELIEPIVDSHQEPIPATDAQKTAHGAPARKRPEYKRTAAVGVCGLLAGCWRFGDGGGRMVG